MKRSRVEYLYSSHKKHKISRNIYKLSVSAQLFENLQVRKKLN